MRKHWENIKKVCLQWVIKSLCVEPLALQRTLQTSPVTSDCCLFRASLCTVVTAGGLQLGTSRCLFCHFTGGEKKRQRKRLMLLFCLAAWPWMCGSGRERRGSAWICSEACLLFILCSFPDCFYYINFSSLCIFPLNSSEFIPALFRFCSFHPVARQNCFKQTSLTMEFWNKKLNVPQHFVIGSHASRRGPNRGNQH